MSFSYINHNGLTEWKLHSGNTEYPSGRKGNCAISNKIRAWKWNWNVGSEIQDIHTSVEYKWVIRWIFFFTRLIWSCFVLQNTLCASVHIQTSETPVVIKVHRTWQTTRSIQVILEKQIDYVITLCWSVWFCMCIVYWMCYLFLPRTAARPQECMRHTKPIDFKISIAAPREATCCQPDSHTLVAKIARRREGSMRMERALKFAATKEIPLWTATWATMAPNSQAFASAVMSYFWRWHFVYLLFLTLTFCLSILICMREGRRLERVCLCVSVCSP